MIGWDAATHAWYHVTQQRYVGCTPDGRVYNGEASYGALKWYDVPPTGQGGVLDGFFPLAALADLSGRRELLTRATIAPDGGLELRYAGPGGGRAPRESMRLPPGVNYPDRDVVLHVDPGGCAVSREVLDPSARPLRFSFAPEVAAPWCLAKEHHGFVLASHEFDPAGDPSRFDPQVVESMAVGAASRVTAASAADATLDASPASSGAGATSGSWAGSWGTWVALAGAALIIAAIATKVLRARAAP